MGFWHLYMGIEGGGGIVVTDPNDGWIANTRTHHWIPTERNRLAIAETRDRLWIAENK